MMEGYDIKELYDEAGRFYGVRIEQEVVQLTREEFKIYKEIERMATNDAHETQRDAQSADASDIR